MASIRPPVGPRVDHAVRLMMGFAERTGLTSEREQRRYLWTDAFAVCNFLGLARATGEEHYTELALRLVDRVHHTLGRYHPDDGRSGWLSGLDETDGAAHPTRGGLRIGKQLPERPAGEAFDEQLEWERDGQYFHYLTKWMHALDQVARATRQPRYNVWARELAATAARAFTCWPVAGPPRLYWKMSVDLSRPLVASTGQHDPLDGFITCAQLRTTAARSASLDAGPDLKEELAGLAKMAEAGEWVTADPLGIGSLLMDACRVEQLVAAGALANSDLLCALLAAALDGVEQHGERNDLGERASRRLAFRELGLAVGLQAITPMDKGMPAAPGVFAKAADLHALLAALRPHAGLAASIESFWLDPANQWAPSWSAHLDINEVMLATSLVPEGCLLLHPATG
jgi:hypothetical protein